MKIELIHNTPLHIAATAIRTCWQSQDKSDTIISPDGTSVFEDENGDIVFGCGPKDKELIDRVGNKFKHSSTLEHLNYTFYIKGVSRALLQEFSRHRMNSLSVKSTRYTLKELKDEKSFEQPYTTKNEDGTKIFDIEKARKRASKYLVFTENDQVDRYSIYALENLRKLIVNGVSNDIAKYALPESYKVELTTTINARALQNFLNLRSNKDALWEIRELALQLYYAIPHEHKYLFKEYVHNLPELKQEIQLSEIITDPQVINMIENIKPEINIIAPGCSI